ncbi:YdeI/OmpD-associated family protein [Devosia aquimaris]|uniref:YdeI/OmpD-associated family protein n=1 Tax=Devosia aquimaris TaxID=2866214 RepID=UPI001CD0BE20|nr:YdeI/OmpD-associated family protein [Devosia sp. CJK-A8-3]
MPSFETQIAQMGNNTGIEVPPAVIEALGGDKKPAVVITIGSFTYRSTVGVMGGKFLIPLSAERRQASGLKGGDAVTVQLERDETPREVVVPEDLAAKLAENPAAQAAFSSLSYSQQLRHVLSVTDARTEETRQRRIEKVLSTMVGSAG